MSKGEVGQLVNKPVISVVHLVGILGTWGAIAYGYGALNNRVEDLELEKNKTIEKAEYHDKKISTLSETCVGLKANSENQTKELVEIKGLLMKMFLDKN